MDQSISELMEVLDCLCQPVLLVREGSILRCNQAASNLCISSDSIDTLLGDCAEFYAAFDGTSPIQLTLQLGGRTRQVTVRRMGDVDLFILAPEGDAPLQLDALYSISNSLRTPLSNLFGVSNTLFPHLEELEDPICQTHMAAMNHAFYQLLHITCSLTDAASLLQGELRLYPEHTEIVEYFGELCQRIEPLCQAAGVNFEYALPPLLFRGWIDRQKVERAVLNLVSNALKFTPAGGTIALRVERSAAGVLLRLSDTGEGIPAAVLSTAFTRYDHPDQLGDPRWGAGFGLPMVQQIAKLHGGAVMLQAQPEGGTVVTMSLCLRKDLADLDALNSPIHKLDYSGGYRHELVELSDALPSSVYDTVNIN